MFICALPPDVDDDPDDSTSKLKQSESVLVGAVLGNTIGKTKTVKMCIDSMAAPAMAGARGAATSGAQGVTHRECRLGCEQPNFGCEYGSNRVGMAGITLGYRDSGLGPSKFLRDKA